MPNRRSPLSPSRISSDSSIKPATGFESGNIQLAQAIKKQYPQLDDNEVTTLGNVVLGEVSKRIGEGKPIAFVEEEDGKPVLSFLRLEVEKRNPNIKLSDISKTKGK